jgi:23S rRNA pseudouridine2604 synthase
MPRPTLKLPKTSASGNAAEPNRSPARKPLRGGAAASKRAGSRATDSRPQPTAKPSRTATGDTPSQAPQPTPAETTSPISDRPSVVSTAPQDREDRPGRALREKFSAPAAADRARKSSKKIHPPRGIARSTGARAFRPAPENTDSEPSLPPAGTYGTASPSEARRAPPPSAPAAAATATGSPPRGLAKESPRLSKLVSELAPCSRREADEWIENGWVSVDGVVINRLGARVNPKAKIMIKEVARARSTESVSIVFNKPRDFPGPAAEEGREAIAALIRADNHWAEDNTPLSFQPTHLRGLAQAGRLETEEGGMLAFTQEGSVARRLSGGDSRLEKEYHVRVEGELAADGLDLLRHGLALDNVKLPRAQVSWLSDQQMRFVLPDGKKGQIQRMCELVGLQVTDIKRVRIGSVSLGKLPPGQWRYLRADERF